MGMGVPKSLAVLVVKLATAGLYSRRHCVRVCVGYRVLPRVHREAVVAFVNVYHNINLNNSCMYSAVSVTAPPVCAVGLYISC